MRWRTGVCVSVFCLWTVPGHAVVIEPVQILSIHDGGPASPDRMSLLSPLDAGSGIVIVRDSASNLSLGGTRDAFGNFSLSSIDRLIIAPETGIKDGMITLRSSGASLTGGTIFGQASLSPTSTISGSSVTFESTAVAPVPLPAAVLLYATGLALLGTLGRTCRGLTQAISTQKFCFACLVSMAMALTPHSAEASSFIGLGDLPGGSFGSASYSLSADGSVVVGNAASSSGTEAFRWTNAAGMVGLGDLPGGFFHSEAYGVSADGAVVVGIGRPESGVEAVRWTNAGGLVGLGDFAGGGTFSYAHGVSADGSVVVGSGTTTTATEAFRWTGAGGMVGLGDLPGGAVHSVAYGTSADGSVVAGTGASTAGQEAFRWTTAGMVGIGDLPGGTFGSVALGVSGNGSAVIGYAKSANGNEAFRWTAGDGMVGLGDLPGGLFESAARGASFDGEMVVGRATVGTTDSAWHQSRAFIWDAANGMRDLQTVLETEHGLGTQLAGWSLHEAMGVSADGSVIVGFGINSAGVPEAWRAQLSPVPVPAALPLFATGLSIFAVALRRAALRQPTSHWRS